jgi:glyoxylase-like metal-dependent hydrolase (beta-lactamase superfamily II)
MGMKLHFLPLGDEAGPSPALYALHGVDLGLDPDKRPFGWEENLDFGGVTLAGLRSPLTMWLIEGADVNIVVDTGCDMSESASQGTREALRDHVIWTDHRPEWTVEAQLARFALRPEDIDVVINTCCHFDHIGNNTKFANATFFIQEAELPYAINPPPWALYYYEAFSHNVLDIRDRLQLIDGDVKITDGVNVKLLGGHSPGTQVVLVETDLGRVCIPGDLVPFYKNLELTWPMGAFFDVKQVMRAYAWMQANADVIVPHHDWQVFEYFPDGCVGDALGQMAAPTGFSRPAIRR